MSRFSNLEFDEGSEFFQNDPAQTMNEAFYLKEARLGFEHRRFEYALRAYAKAIELSPESAMRWFQPGLCQAKLGMVTQANASYQHALELNPDNYQVRSCLHQDAPRSSEVNNNNFKPQMTKKL